jgi:hypothetical protein
MSKPTIISAEGSELQGASSFWWNLSRNESCSDTGAEHVPITGT